MHSMFEGCSALTSLDLSGFDTSSAEHMSNMFFGCSSLESVALGERFSFRDGCTLPGGWWRSAATGRDYTATQLSLIHI